MSSVTGSPKSRAAALTGLGDTPEPRPRRLSGRDTTRGISKPAATRACRGGTAIAGVPRYARRRGCSGGATVKGVADASAQREAGARGPGALLAGLEAEGELADGA